MKTEHIPLLSYIFIGVTSLVLTYATIADKTNDIIEIPVTDTLSTPELSTPSVPGVVESSVEKIKSLLPFSGESQPSTTDNERDDEVTTPDTIPIAKPVNDENKPVNDDNKQLYGGKKNKKNTRRKGKNTKVKSKAKTKNRNKKLK
jgi:hypothetical protein